MIGLKNLHGTETPLILYQICLSMWYLCRPKAFHYAAKHFDLHFRTGGVMEPIAALQDFLKLVLIQTHANNREVTPLISATDSVSVSSCACCHSVIEQDAASCSLPCTSVRISLS